jgi:hypothetical protein
MFIPLHRSWKDAQTVPIVSRCAAHKTSREAMARKADVARHGPKGILEARLRRMIEDEVGGGLRLRDRGSVQLKGHGPILVICD